MNLPRRCRILGVVFYKARATRCSIHSSGQWQWTVAVFISSGLYYWHWWLRPLLFWSVQWQLQFWQFGLRPSCGSFNSLAVQW